MRQKNARVKRDPATKKCNHWTTCNKEHSNTLQQASKRSLLREIRQTTTNIATLPYVHGVSQFTYVRNSHEARGFSSYTIKATEPQQTAKRSTGAGGRGGGKSGLETSPQQAQSRYGAVNIQQQLQCCAHQPGVWSGTVQRTYNSCSPAAHTSQDVCNLTQHSMSTRAGYDTMLSCGTVPAYEKKRR